jgi:hypothetical protein
MKIPYIIIKREKIAFKDKLIESYKKIIEDKDEHIKDQFIDNMSLHGQIFSITQKHNKYVEFYRDEKNNNIIISNQLEATKKELNECKKQLKELIAINKSNKDILNQYEADKYIAKKNLINKASNVRLKKKREKELYLDILKNEKK